MIVRTDKCHHCGGRHRADEMNTSFDRKHGLIKKKYYCPVEGGVVSTITWGYF